MSEFILSGDLGGTKTILRLSEVQANGEMSLVCQGIYRSQDYPGFTAIVKQFLQDYSPENLSIDKACFGIAGAVVNNTSLLPNLGWHLCGDELEGDLSIEQIKLINDFAAIGYGIPELAENDLLVLHKGKPQLNQPIALIGAGTGLGEAFLIHHHNDYIVVPSEGGNSDFAAQNDRQFTLMKYIAKKYDLEQVSVEEVVSGRGIVAIYCFLRDNNIAIESPDIAQVVKKWESEEHKTVDPAAMISQSAINKTDVLAQETMKMFLEAYGAEASNLALKSLPYSGVYIAGGIASKNRSLMVDGTFIKGFLDKGRSRFLVEDMPVYVILNEEVGLLGATAYARKMLNS